jgi:multiple sugar transport system permease protein
MPLFKKKYYNSYRIDTNNKLAALLLGPSILFVGIISLYPLIYSVYLSLFNYQLTRPDKIRFAPLSNIRKLLQDELFFRSLLNTVIFTVITVAAGLILGMIMALVLEELPKRFGKLRGILIMPWVIPGIVVGYLFMYIFDTNVGIVNYIFLSLGLIQKRLPWLMRDNLAMASVIIANVWNQAPFYMLMFTAAMKSIPESIREASYAEGAGRWNEFFQVTLPHIKGVVVITSLLQIIRNFNNFPIIFTMTGGGPAHATTTSVLYIYKVAFDQFDMGYASLIGIFWVIVLMILSVIYIRLLNKEY